MKPIKQKYTIAASVEEVWKALTDSKYINAWGGGPANMSDKVGAQFSLWGKDIHGTNLEIIPHKKLKQEWYADYDTPSYLTFTLSSKGNQTIVELLHEEVPADKYKDIEDGWRQYYMNPLKEYVEQKAK